MKDLLTVHATHTSPGVWMTKRDIDVRDRQHGLAGIGYHFVIDRDGKVQDGRPLTSASVHDELRDAKRAISVVLVGGHNCQGEPSEIGFTPNQWTGLRGLIRCLRDSTDGPLSFKSATPAITDELLAAHHAKALTT